MTEKCRGSVLGRCCSPPLIAGLSEATCGSCGSYSLLRSRGVHGGMAPVPLWGGEETGGGGRLYVKRQRGGRLPRQLSLPSASTCLKATCICLSRVGGVQGGRKICCHLVQGGKGPRHCFAVDGRHGRRRRRCVAKGGESWTRTHFAGSAAKRSPRAANLVTRLDSVIKDPQGKLPAGARRASFNVRRAASSSALIDPLLPGGLRHTTPQTLAAEARRAPASSVLLDAPPHGLRSTTSQSHLD